MLLVTVFAFCTNRASLSPLLLRSFLFLHAFPSLFFRHKCVFPLVFLRWPSRPPPSKPANAESGGSGRYFLTLKKRCAHTVRMTIYAIFSAHLYIYSLQLFKSFVLPRKTAAFHRCSGPAPGTGGASAVSRGDLAPELSFLNPHSKILL